jgi:hypothetical protein
LVGEFGDEFRSEKWLLRGAVGEEKRQKSHSKLAFLAFRIVIYMDVGGYTGKVENYIEEIRWVGNEVSWGRIFVGRGENSDEILKG